MSIFFETGGGASGKKFKIKEFKKTVNYTAKF